MNDDLIEVFQRYIKVDFDERLYHNIKALRWSWSQKSEEYIEFLGSNLTGVHTIRFSSQDEDMLFLDILNVDKATLKYELHRTKGIDKTRKVAANVVYLTLIYIMHGFARSKTIGKHMEDAIRETYYIFAYKAISSLYSHYFKYPVDIGLAQAVNERLTNKFLLKKFKNWAEVFEYRSRDVLPKGHHWGRILMYDADNSARIINDLQSRIRDLVKNIYVVLIEIKENNERIISTSLETNDAEGEKAISDLMNRPDMYANFCKSICRSKVDFIRPDICHIIEKISGAKLAQPIEPVLEVIIEEFEGLEKFIDDVMVSSIECLASKDINGGYDKDLYNTILILKTLYGNVSKIKLATEAKKSIVNFLHKTRNRKVKGKKFIRINMGVCVCIYVFLRSILKDK